MIIRKIVKLLKLLKKETACMKIKKKCKEMAYKKAMKIPDDRKCRNCRYSHFIKDECTFCSGYECNLNPLEPISLGTEAKHEDMKKVLAIK